MLRFCICPAPPRVRLFTNGFKEAIPRQYSNPGDQTWLVAGAMQVKLRKRLFESWSPLETTRPMTPPNNQYFTHH